MLKTIRPTASLLAVSLVVATPVTAAEPEPSWATEVGTINNVTGKGFEYVVSGYRIRMDFIAADRIRRTRIDAADDSAGTTGEEEIIHTDPRPGVFSIAFTDAEGNVVDIFDLQRKRLFVTYITNDGKRIHSETAIKDVTS